MHDMGYRVNQNILNAWAENAGESFDWCLEGYSGLPVLDTTAPLFRRERPLTVPGLNHSMRLYWAVLPEGMLRKKNNRKLDGKG